MFPISAVLFLIGLLLILIEVFIPGFGLPGICGLILIGIASLIAANTYGFAAVIIVLLVLAAVGMILFKVLKRHNIYHKLVLQDALVDQVYDQKSINHLMGKEGITLTPLKPGGKAEFEGKVADVFSNGEFIAKGREVKVIGIQGRDVIVKEIYPKH